MALFKEAMPMGDKHCIPQSVTIIGIYCVQRLSEIPMQIIARYYLYLSQEIVTCFYTTDALAPHISLWKMHFMFNPCIPQKNAASVIEKEVQSNLT